MFLLHFLMQELAASIAAKLGVSPDAVKVSAPVNSRPHLRVCVFVCDTPACILIRPENC